MNLLIGNGSSLYRYGGSLLRTPIVIKNKKADERAYYDVAGRYDSAGWPASGFIQSITSSTKDACETAGLNMYNSYAGIKQPSGGVQIWRQVSSAHDPECCWYQGAYATSATSISTGKNQCEAFVRCCGYRFQKPRGLESLELTSWKIRFTFGGFLALDGAIADGTAVPYSATGTDGHLFFVHNQLIHPYLLTQNSSSYPHKQYVANCAPWDGGFRDLWGFGSSSKDGGIAALRSPISAEIEFGENAISVFNTNGGAWVIGTPNMGYSTHYYPYYGAGARNRWKCHTLWSITSDMVFEPM